MTRKLQSVSAELIGQPLERKDGVEKVTGRLRYAADLILPNMLHAVVVTSPYPHARVVQADTSQISNLPGVKVVITADDVPDRRRGQLYMDRPIVTRKARFVGDIVAAIAAESEALARKAAQLIQIKYEQLPAVFDLDEAFSTNPPTIIHEDIDSYRRAETGHPLVEKGGPFGVDRDRSRPNNFALLKVEIGSVEEGFRDSDLIVENVFTTGMCYQAPLEPHAAMADVNPTTGRVTVYSACQSPYRAKMELCELFDLPPSHVTFINPPVGGGFGNKSYLTIEDLAVALSMKAKRPVKLVLPRHDDITSTVCRNGSKVTIKDGVSKNGKLVVRDITVLFNAGAYNDATMKYILSTVYAAASTYKIPNFRYDSYAVYTNTQVNGAFRGFGMSEVEWASERQIDIIAEKLGIDPVEIRKRNIIRDNLSTVNEEMGDVRIEECLNRVVEASDYWRSKQKKASGKGKVRRGLGIAIANKGVNMHKTSMTLKLHSDGDLELRTGSQEIGSGSISGLAQIVANEFKVPFEKVDVVTGDTRLTPYDEGCTGSRAIPINGSCAVAVCNELKKEIFSLASKIIGVPSGKLDYANDRIFLLDDPEKSINVSELFVKTQFGVGTLAKKQGELIATVTYDLRDSVGNRPIFHQSFTVGAQAAQVEVDLETGRVDVIRTVTAVDIGKPINRQSVQNQIEGGVVQGVGTALYEELRAGEDGRLLNPSFMDYKILTAGEQPPLMEGIIVESKDNFGPYGAKSIGEFPIIVTAPAIASAIFDAIGVQLTHMPMTKERVLKEITSRGT